jgi:hypothetical protein
VYISINIVEMAASMYSEMREEARDHARIRNAYLEQVYPQDLFAVTLFKLFLF